MSLYKNTLNVIKCPLCGELAINDDERILDTTDNIPKHYCMACNVVFKPFELDKELRHPMKGSDLTRFMKSHDRTITTRR